LQHIDFSLPRKHKPALFIVTETAPLTTTAAQMGRPYRRASRDLSPTGHLIKIFNNRITID
jgi:hypothetical protein